MSATTTPRRRRRVDGWVIGSYVIVAIFLLIFELVRGPDTAD